MTENLGNGTAKGLIDYLDSLVEKGRSRSGVVTPLKTAITKVLEKTEGDDWEKVDVTKLDVDDAISRFKNLTLTTYTDASYRAYELRTKRAIKWYENFLENPGWYPKESMRTPRVDNGSSKLAQTAEKTQGASKKSGKTDETSMSLDAPGSHSSAPKIDAVAYPFPLANGEMARIFLPKGITTADVKRMSVYLEALVITEGGNE